jgi:hypothetical protein
MASPIRRPVLASRPSSVASMVGRRASCGGGGAAATISASISASEKM